MPSSPSQFFIESCDIGFVPIRSEICSVIHNKTEFVRHARKSIEIGSTVAFADRAVCLIGRLIDVIRFQISIAERRQLLCFIFREKKPAVQTEKFNLVHLHLGIYTARISVFHIPLHVHFRNQTRQYDVQFRPFLS